MSALPGGRPTGTAVKAAKTFGGPEVSAAASAGQALGGAGGGAKGKGAATGGKRRRQPITPDMSSDQVNAELQARRTDAASGPPVATPPAGPSTTPRTAPAPPPPGAGPSLPGALTNQTGSPGWWAPVANPGQTAQAAANAGGGFLLGLGLWAVGLAYLRGGSPEVRKLLAAKFLNKTGG